MKLNRVTEILANWPLRKGNLHQRLAAAIEDAIRQGNFLPGTRLPAERSLAKSLAVSRTTVLTAYNHLRTAGWLESRSGSGTWVSRKTAAAARASMQGEVIAGSPMLNLLSIRESGAIDFAVTTTEPLAGFPLESFELPRELHRAILLERNYLPFGLPMLRDAVARRYSKLGLPTTSDEVLITTGAQQAISLITSLYVQRGDPILVENPTYFGALEVFRFAGARMMPVEISAPGHISADSLRKRILTTHPRLIYLTPTHQNPTGATMPAAHRREAARLCGEYAVPLMEDEVLAEMTFDGKRSNPIAQYAEGATVLTIGSLSKLFCPGIRVGWIRGPVSVIGRLAKVKSMTDLGSALLTQAIGAQLLSEIDRAVTLRRQELVSKMRLVSGLLRNDLHDWEFDEPSGGLCLWVRIPNGDARALSQVALRHQVGVAAGNLFSVDNSYTEFLRIPFVLDNQFLAQGIERLARAWRELSGFVSHRDSSYAMIV